MTKELLTQDKVCGMIRRCYESDAVFINNYHELENSSVDECVNRTVSDLKNVDVYAIYSPIGRLVGYFGDNKNGWLTGFFIMPEYRLLKSLFWKVINEHFSSGFSSGVLVKNNPAINFFKSNGCVFSHYEPSIDGLGMIFVKGNN